MCKCRFPFVNETESISVLKYVPSGFSPVSGLLYVVCAWAENDTTTMQSSTRICDFIGLPHLATNRESSTPVFTITLVTIYTDWNGSVRLGIITVCTIRNGTARPATLR